MIKQLLLCCAGIFLFAAAVCTAERPAHQHGPGVKYDMPGSKHGASGMEYDAPLREYLMLDTDRDIYIAGEDLFLLLQLRGMDKYGSNINNNGLGKLSRFAYVVLRGKHGQVKNISLELDGPEGGGRIYLPDTLSSGYYQLVALTSWMRNQGEEHYAFRDILVVNRFDQDFDELLMARPGQPGMQETELRAMDQLTVESLRDRYGRREPVEMKVSSADPGDPLEALQVVVARREALHRPDAGYPETTGPTKPAGENHQAAGGIPPDMPRSQAPDPGSFEFPVEITRQVISGRALHTWSGVGLQGIRVLLGTPDTLLTLLYCHTDAQGYFVFHLDAFYRNRELYLVADPATTNQPVTIEVHDKFKLETPFTERPFAGMLGKRDYIGELQEMTRINKVFDVPTHAEGPEEPKSGIPPLVYGRPAGTFFPGLYEPLDNLREISREITGPWRIRSSGGRLTHSLVGATTRSLLPGEPVLFIDGIMTTDLGTLLSLSSATVSRIEVHNMDWYYGDMNFPGIVAIFTKNRDYRDLDLLPEPFIHMNHAPEARVHHFAPDYLARDDRETDPSKPDLRQTLYWNPDVRPGETIGWYTGDVRGEYVVRIHGRTANGRQVSAIKSFSVE